jgi:outer membrane receptor for ferrienterochelin and colicins
MTQNIRGTIVDVDTQSPLIGATVKVLDIEGKLYAGVSNFKGDYSVLNVPVGKHVVEFYSMGYEPKVITVVVTVGKESIVNIS